LASAKILGEFLGAALSASEKSNFHCTDLTFAYNSSPCGLQLAGFTSADLRRSGPDTEFEFGV